MTTRLHQVFVTVGTDHHHFDRLLDWVEAWSPPAALDVSVVIQHGCSKAPRRHQGVAFMDAQTLQSHLQSADVIVAQGGPGSIMDARRAGRRPIVVPRRSDLNEVVDDHQLSFVEHLSARGLVVAAHTMGELHAHLTASVVNSELVRTQPMGPTPAETISAFTSAVDGVLKTGRAGWRQRLPRRPDQSQPKLRPSSV